LPSLLTEFADVMPVHSEMGRSKYNRNTLRKQLLEHTAGVMNRSCAIIYSGQNMGMEINFKHFICYLPCQLWP